MSDSLRKWADIIGTGVDVAGVFVILIGMILATGRFLYRARTHTEKRYAGYRQEIGHAILLGLEFLVAGDIIRTVVVEPTMENVKVLGMIVLIRTFLSIALQVEIERRWPWHRAGD